MPGQTLRRKERISCADARAEREPGYARSWGRPEASAVLEAVDAL
jgi:hypothetical protein